MTALTRNPSNTDLLQSTKFRLVFERFQGLTFFCQSANLPGVSLTEIPRPTPFIDLYHPGEKMLYDTLNVTFLVNEDLQSWIELHDWIRGATFPTNFEEYVKLTRETPGSNIRASYSKSPVYSDASMTIYSNKNNPRFRIKFADIFPTNVGSILFNVSDTAENIITADATFRFSYYNIEKL